jgi:secreted PhoX family phosphatase
MAAREEGRAGSAPAWAAVPPWTDGSLANCAGGVTPWGTALSAEENWADYATVYGWGPDFAAVNNGGYGWVMEVDPAEPNWTPRKHTNLGRLRHENATVWAREGKQVVVYTGDDSRNKFLYKYVSDGSYHQARGRRNSRLLEDGRLWVAEFAPASQDETVLAGTGRWHRIEMSPAAVKGFSSPDNLVFDRLGNLWMVTDISSGSLNEGVYAYHRNKGIFMIRVGGPDAGIAFRFGSVPNEAESTGPIWTPHQTTMFLAIQHPGEETSVSGGVHGDPTTYTSYWPRGNKTTGENPGEPLPSVIAIHRA